MFQAKQAFGKTCCEACSKWHSDETSAHQSEASAQIHSTSAPAIHPGSDHRNHCIDQGRCPMDASTRQGCRMIQRRNRHDTTTTSNQATNDSSIQANEPTYPWGGNGFGWGLEMGFSSRVAAIIVRSFSFYRKGVFLLSCSEDLGSDA
jgi:hypothetical protein